MSDPILLSNAASAQGLNIMNGDQVTTTSRMHPQIESPLFNKIPPEIRNNIFWLALQEYEDPKNKYAYTTYYFRPGHRAKKRVDTALLLTCKRIYEETKVIPLQNLERCFYLGWGKRAPLEYRYRSDNIFDVESNDYLSTEQWKKIKSIRIFAQLFACRPTTICDKLFSEDRAALAPSTITITVRYTDWYHWETNSGLSLHHVNPTQFSFPDCVSKIVMELETIESKRKELEWVVEGVLRDDDRWTWGRRDGRQIKLNRDKSVKEWKWEGTTMFGYVRFEHHPSEDSMPYIVKVLTWDVISGEPHQTCSFKEPEKDPLPCPTHLLD